MDDEQSPYSDGSDEDNAWWSMARRTRQQNMTAATVVAEVNRYLNSEITVQKADIKRAIEAKDTEREMVARAILIRAEAMKIWVAHNV